MSLDSGGPSKSLESHATSAFLQPPTTPETNRTRSDVQSTLFKSKPHSVTGHSSSLSLNTKHQKYTTFLANNLRKNGRVQHNIDCFLTDFVGPCDEPIPLVPLDWDLFADYKPDGKKEDCGGMVRFTT